MNYRSVQETKSCQSDSLHEISNWITLLDDARGSVIRTYCSDGKRAHVLHRVSGVLRFGVRLMNWTSCGVSTMTLVEEYYSQPVE
jgi:hypothetical protein